MAQDSLFKTFSKNLIFYKPGYENIFLCPLQVSPNCKETYEYKEIHLLNKAHIWPQSLGGKAFTLACKHCNSYIGTKLESHMSNHAKFMQSEKLPFRMRHHGVDGSEGGELEITDEKIINFYMNDKISNPYTTEEIKNLYSTGQPPEMILTIKGGFSKRKVGLGYLHFAYLYLFHTFGYEWFFTLMAEKVREQLKKVNERLFEVHWTIVGSSVIEISPDLPFHTFVTVPQELRGLNIVSPLLNYIEDRRVAVLFCFKHSKHDSQKLCSPPPEYIADTEVQTKFPVQDSHNNLGEGTGFLTKSLYDIFGPNWRKTA